MKLLVLNYEYPPLGGGAGPICRELALRMAAAGHRVDVVTMGFRGLPAEEDDHGVRVWRVPCMRRSKSSCMPWEQVTYLLALRRFLRKRPDLAQSDVCHCHFVVPTGPGALRLKRKQGVPYVLTAHGSDVEGHNSRPLFVCIHRLIRPLWRKAAAGASYLVAPSSYLAGLIRKCAPWLRTLEIPNGVELPDVPVGGGPRERLVLLVGRMQKSKDFATALRALSRLEGVEWRADVLGDGPERAALERLSEDLGLAGQVRFRGWVDHEDPLREELLRRAAVFVSTSEYENSPVAVLEAAAAGCQTLLSDIPGHREMLREQASYFPIHDDLALSALLRSALEGDRLPVRYDIGRFAWERVAAQYEELLAKAARGDRA